MKVISQNKLAKRLLLLFVLTGTLIYLRVPTKAHADERETCLALCAEAAPKCLEKCGDDQSCINACDLENEACIAYCDTLP
jgi:hypothetical protein